jgi:hypothetical protein
MNLYPSKARAPVDSVGENPDSTSQKAGIQATKPDRETDDARITDAAKSAEAAVIRRIAEIADFLKVEKGNLYSDAGDALKEVRKDFYYWSTKLTESSFALSLAVIAANWAVFGSLDKILNNRWSQFSIASVILSLGLNIIGYKRLIDALRRQIRYAEADRARWGNEFKTSLRGPSDWPYTAKISRIAQFHRACRMWLPLVGGMLFLVALFAASAPAPKVIKTSPTPSPQSSPAPSSSASPRRDIEPKGESPTGLSSARF